MSSLYLSSRIALFKRVGREELGRSHGFIFMLQTPILMHFVLSHAPQDCMSLVLLFCGAIAALASFTAYIDFHYTLSLVGSRTNNLLSFVFGSRVSIIMRKQLRITSVDLTYLIRYVTKSISFPIASLIFYFTSRVLLPVVIFGLFFSRPILSNPARRLCLSLRPNSEPANLCGRSRCMFSSLNSVNAYDQHLFEFNHDFALKNHAIQSSFC